MSWRMYLFLVKIAAIGSVLVIVPVGNSIVSKGVASLIRRASDFGSLGYPWSPQVACKARLQ